MISNADPKEIAKFSAIAADWWNNQGQLKSLHDINPLRLKFIEHQVKLSEQTVLDVGCGGGILAEALAKKGAKVTGIDLSETAIAVAKQHAAQQNLTIHYQITAVEALAQQQPENFDIITCMELLEHVPDPAQVISACAQLVKPGGKLFFATINRNAKSYLSAILGAEYVLHLLPKGTHDYMKFIRPAELAAWARAASLTVNLFQGMSYNIFSKTYYLTDNIDVNYCICCVKS